MAKRVFILCGEASGDLHAANLVREWKEMDQDTVFQAWGGDRLIAENVPVLKHVKELSFMGFIEVLKHLFTILRNFKECKRSLMEFKPDAIILVDFPGFNLRMARWAKEQGITVIYYISPQLWAWKQGRIKQVKRYVDFMYCILPFEKAFYARFNYKVSYFGHPLLDEIHRFKQQGFSLASSKHPTVALLPGSRLQEVRRKLPIMLAAVKNLEGYQVVIACSNQLPLEIFEEFDVGNAQLVFGKTYEVLQSSQFALVTSGTATLETALFRVPQVVCYKSNTLSYWIARQVVKIRYISLVNLILNEPLVEELIQHRCNERTIRAELNRLIQDDGYRNSMIAGYDRLIVELGNQGASQRNAASMLETF
ncbi:MAG: lipid-A-disaccharide synthase [Flavobacteriia bacterium]|jgi:lipid-A-disaccharide synthase|nr:lipid-A-disaccharide synthase [Flavobacteriia bacterium]NBP28266.1 lipid-A-disaccharide synthase [Flavobacteriia bacterium]